jgi:hypothetical protein
MSIDAISASTNSNQTNDMQANLLQMRKYFEQLGQALQSGDLSGAQSAFSSLQQILSSSSANQGQATQQTGQNTLTADMNALSQALKSGDMSKAQDAFTKLQQDMQAAQKGHHRHHHKSDSSQNSVSDSNTTLSPSDVGISDPESDTNINLIA